MKKLQCSPRSLGHVHRRWGESSIFSSVYLRKLTIYGMKSYGAGRVLGGENEGQWHTLWNRLGHNMSRDVPPTVTHQLQPPRKCLQVVLPEVHREASGWFEFQHVTLSVKYLVFGQTRQEQCVCPFLPRRLPAFLSTQYFCL